MNTEDSSIVETKPQLSSILLNFNIAYLFSSLFCFRKFKIIYNILNLVLINPLIIIRNELPFLKKYLKQIMQLKKDTIKKKL